MTLYDKKLFLTKVCIIEWSCRMFLSIFIFESAINSFYQIFMKDPP